MVLTVFFVLFSDAISFLGLTDGKPKHVLRAWGSPIGRPNLSPIPQAPSSSIFPALQSERAENKNLQI